MSVHDHKTIVEGCYRCELNADELDPRFDVKPTTHSTDPSSGVSDSP